MESVHITCKKCKSYDEGCSLCGGFKVLLTQVDCPTCHRKFWVKPKAETVYDGKQTVSFDGVIVWHWMEKPNTCSQCGKSTKLKRKRMVERDSATFRG